MTTVVLKRTNGKTLYTFLKFATLTEAMQYALNNLNRLVDVLDANDNSLYF